MVAPQAVTGRLDVRNVTVMFSAIQKVNIYKLKTSKASLLGVGQK